MKKVFILILVCLFLVTSCTTDHTQPPQLTPTHLPPTQPPPLTSTPTAFPEGASQVVFSEILAGVKGNNNYEFIELYNRSMEIIDLHGWSIWYRLPTSREDLFVYRWTSRALIPPQGHYLLGYSGQDIGITVDAQYDQALNTTGGGLQLRQTDGKILDTIGWGNPQDEFVESKAAPALPNGVSLERMPGGETGNAQDQDDNSIDFILVADPNPQNSGSSLTPLPTAYIELLLQAPAKVEPGSHFTYTLTVTNHCSTTLNHLQTIIPIHPEFIISSLPSGITLEEGTLTWILATLEQEQSQSIQIPVEVPWTYFTAALQGYYATAEGCPLPAFGEPITTQIEGGVIPIGTARTLLGADLTIEGIATAYTGAYYAGTGNVKFYLQDNTGAIQVQVFEGQGSVNIKIGTQVRVRGNVSVYRGSTQIVPIIVPDDVTILQPPGDDLPKPITATISAATSDLLVLPGKYVQVQGVVTRVQEFTYSYELDLADQEDPTQLITLYIDKQTGIQVEQIETGDRYIASGILDIRDTRHLLYPRVQDDLQQIYPPEPRVDAEGPALVSPNQPITYTVTAYNHTTQPISSPLLQVTLPVGTRFLQAIPEGKIEGDNLSWQLPDILPFGDSQQVQFSVTLTDSNLDEVTLSTITLASSEWPNLVNGPVIRTFTNGMVPIWAIQGNGFRSPYLLSTITTQGVVTGVFPDLSGFFIQEIFSDADPLTSSGLFISTGNSDVSVESGNLVQITGKVRELSGQTSLQIFGPASINVLSANHSIPSPIDLDPPASLDQALVYYEALEGSLVQVSQPAIAVSPISKYGEYVVVLATHGVNRLYQGQDNGIAIMIDDGSDTTHLDSSTLPYVVVSGDTINQIIGPLAYTYERYKVEPLSIPEIDRTGMQPTTLLPTSANEFSLMTWNVENLFDPADPHPSDPPKPLPSEYQIDLDKVASTINAAGNPTIIALQEVENLRVLEDLVNHPLLADYHYEPVLIEGFDSRGIDVGYLLQRDLVSILEVQQRDASAGLFSRPPLLLKLEIDSGETAYTIYLLNNHFASMSAGEEATEPQRSAQAAWNLQLVQEILANEPDAFIAVMGDLNSYYDSPPIQILREGGLIHVLELLPPEARYTYIYQGNSQVLDHIMITAALLDILERVDILHVNSDFPLSATDDNTPWHKSDHDPVIVTFLPK